MIKKLFVYGIIVGIIACIAVNMYVKLSTASDIVPKEYYQKLQGSDCIIVLGAGIWGDKPSPMLEDRLLECVNLYYSNVSNKIIMSGDHREKGYDEVNVMKNYAISKGIPSENIFMDHAGFSTYDTIYRAKYIFGAQNVVIVTQKYHLYRTLYIAHKLGLDAVGVCANSRSYAGQTYREMREILARNKDFVKCIFRPLPTCLGNVIPLSGSGDVTNDLA